MTLLRQVVLKTGVPAAIYSDRHSIFWPTNGESLKEQLAGRRSPTQFGRAMADLGIQLIAAHSPQAKGRVERLWGTLQDRLVSELRLAQVTTIEPGKRLSPGLPCALQPALRSRCRYTWAGLPASPHRFPSRR